MFSINVYLLAEAGMLIFYLNKQHESNQRCFRTDLTTARLHLSGIMYKWWDYVAIYAKPNPFLLNKISLNQIMRCQSQVQDQSLDPLTCSPQCYGCPPNMQYNITKFQLIRHHWNWLWHQVHLSPFYYFFFIWTNSDFARSGLSVGYCPKWLFICLFMHFICNSWEVACTKAIP